MAATLRRTLVIALALTVLAILAPGQAEAQGSGGSLTCTPTTVSVGGTVTCTLGTPPPYGTGCAAGETVEFLWNGAAWASAVANADGGASVTAPVPADAVPGPVDVTASCGGGDVLSTQIMVVASVSQPAPVRTVTPPASAATTSLPITGADSISWLQVGLVLIAVGGLLVVASRKRSASGASAG